MNIPDSIKIGDTWIPVYKLDYLSNHDKTIYFAGLAGAKLSYIKLAKYWLLRVMVKRHFTTKKIIYNQEQIEDSFLHEIIHHIDYEYCKETLTEGQVKGLA